MPRTVASEALSLCLQALILKFNKCGDFHILMIDRRSLHNSEAESYAIDGFCEYAYAETPFPDIIIPEKLPLNWLVYPYKAKK